MNNREASAVIVKKSSPRIFASVRGHLVTYLPRHPVNPKGLVVSLRRLLTLVLSLGVAFAFFAAPVSAASFVQRASTTSSLTTGTITGTVANTSGQPLAGIDVSTTGQNGNVHAATTTSSGTYSLTGLAAYSYSVSFSDPNNVYFSTSSVVSVTPGTSTTQNVTLYLGGTVTGTVTNTLGNPLSGIDVSCLNGGVQTTTTTTGSGTYSCTELDYGSYTLSFNDPHQVYGSATASVTVTAGSTTQNEVLIAGSITGTVTSVSGKPLAGINVSTSGQLGNSHSAITSSTGTYTLTGLAPYSYSVQFSDPNGTYSGVTSQISVSAGAPTTTFNETMLVPGSLSGTVTNNLGNPIPGIVVSTIGPLGNPHTTTTNRLGFYAFSGLLSQSSSNSYYSYNISCNDPNNVYAPSSSTVIVDQYSATILNETLSAFTPFIASVSIVGTPDVGQTLTAVANGVTGTPAPTPSFQWLDNGVPISGATSSTYVLQPSDYNQVITVTVIETNNAGSARATSSATLKVGGTAPTVSSVFFTGVAIVGQTLTAGVSGVTGTPNPVPSYQWFANGAPISGATSSTYVPVASDAGYSISVRVNETNMVGSISINSSLSAKVTSRAQKFEIPMASLFSGNSASLHVSNKERSQLVQLVLLTNGVSSHRLTLVLHTLYSPSKNRRSNPKKMGDVLANRRRSVLLRYLITLDKSLKRSVKFLVRSQVHVTKGLKGSKLRFWRSTLLEN